MSNVKYVERPPRLQPELPQAEHNIPEPPDEGQAQAQPLIQVFLPLVTSLGYVLLNVLGKGRNLLMMLPMAIEMARCVEEGIVGSPAEADLALVYGVGFPPFRGGIFRWMDTVGMAHIAEASAKFAHLGKAYELTGRMQEMLASGETYY